jgi:hypothetical protein
VTVCANEFKAAGIIDYQRGHIQMVDRKRLEEVACDCYHIIKGEYDSLYADLANPLQPKRVIRL